MTWQVFAHHATLIGHRGMGKGVVAGHRENTTESFRAAAEAGLEWVELDVQRTLDDDLVVHHDPVLPDGRHLARMTGDQAVRQGTVRLDDLLDALPPALGVAFDIKSGLYDATRPPDSTTAALLARRCRRGLGARPALALSFDPGALKHMRETVPGMALGLLTWMGFPVGHAVAAAAHLDVQVLAVHTSSLWPSPAAPGAVAPPVEHVVETVHASQRQVLVWCPDTSMARELRAARVDALVVDDVPRHVRARADSRGTDHSYAP